MICYAMLCYVLNGDMTLVRPLVGVRASGTASALELPDPNVVEQLAQHVIGTP